MTPLLKSITVTNFRSILGEVTVPLDAPVVLIYGQNGSGKTSILSAIELGLTGRISSFRRVDPAYVSHLVHKEATEGRIAVAVDSLNGASKLNDLVISSSRVIGNPLFSGVHAHFYSERCYLAQATLSRLLEIYEYEGAHRSKSPLTKFVKELLGLNYLDALIDGLHRAGDIRRLRVPLPLYWRVRKKVPELKDSIKSDAAERERVENQIKAIDDQLPKKLDHLGIQADVMMSDAELTRVIESRQEDKEFRRLAQYRLKITATTDEWQTIRSATDPVCLNKAEKEASGAHSALKTWKLSDGRALENLLTQLSEFFPNLPSPNVVGPEQARSAALAMVTAELSRCSATLSKDSEDAATIPTLDQQIVKAREHLAMLDHHITKFSSDSDALAQLLAVVLQHIDSDDCPVCGRNFSEISDETLDSHVSKRLTALSKNAEQLQALIRERSNTSQIVAETVRQRREAAVRLMKDVAREELKLRKSRLGQLKRALTDIAQPMATGEQMILAADKASRRLNELRSQNQRGSTIQATIVQIARDLRLPPSGDTESVDTALERLQADITKRELTLRARQSTLRDALEDVRERRTLLGRRTEITNTISAKRSQMQHLVVAKKKARKRIDQAKALAHEVRETRARIVRRVFNDSLNKVWRDLFVRLAPDEPFVPAFALPKIGSGPVEVILETFYRAGGKGGNPRSMLSSANLNTAALTFFLALHLSVKPTLPWLVIDDPVQSMDEVHISQFAALLRTLSKQHKRQLIISVHEKPLFDYLSLELSPAFPKDSLITVEIARTMNGETLLEWKSQTWSPDPAIAGWRRNLFL